MDLPPPLPLKLENPYAIVAQDLPGAASELPTEFYRATGNDGGAPLQAATRASGNDSGGAPVPADRNLPTQP